MINRLRDPSLDEVAQALDQQMNGHPGACRWPIWERLQFPSSSTHRQGTKCLGHLVCGL